MTRKQKGKKLFKRLKELEVSNRKKSILKQKIKDIPKVAKRSDTRTPEAFLFLRCFVPYYHNLLVRKAETEPLRPLVDALAEDDGQGRCVGDAHPENFGMIYNNQAEEKRFIMNDADDGGVGPLYADFLRLLVAVDLAEKGRLDLEPILTAYRKGINDDLLQACRVVQSLELAAEGEKEMKNKDYKKKIKEELNDEENRNKLRTITGNEKNEIARILEAEFSGTVKYKKGVHYIKVVGGSGGLKRFRFLVKFTDDNNPFRPNLSADKGILELKELTTPGQYPEEVFSTRKISDIVKENLTFCQGSQLGNFYRIVEINNKPYELRPRWRCFKGIQLFKDNSLRGNRANRMDVYQNEAQILGKLHRTKAVNRQAYQAKLDAIPWVHWRQAIEYLAGKMKTDYKNLKEFV